MALTERDRLAVRSLLGAAALISFLFAVSA